LKTSKHRTHPKAGWCNIKKLPKGPNGRALCRFCKTEVPKGRRSFCCDDCVHEWKLRSNTAYLRHHTFLRDHGICNKCSKNTIKVQGELLEEFKPIKFKPWTEEYKEFLKKHDITYHQMTTTLWHTDHITPVVEGGGLCGLDGVQTLCIWCHKEETKALRGRLKKKK
jgi:5-methylcytosine-specific restriction enzyme A